MTRGIILVKIALTIWGNRISPVFDSSKTLMIVDIEKSKPTNRVYERFDPLVIKNAIKILHNYEVDILICGAISETHALCIEQSGIKLISFISGMSDKVLSVFIKKRYRILDFLMPGAISGMRSKFFFLTFY